MMLQNSVQTPLLPEDLGDCTQFLFKSSETSCLLQCSGEMQLKASIDLLLLTTFVADQPPHFQTMGIFFN